MGQDETWVAAVGVAASAPGHRVADLPVWEGGTPGPGRNPELARPRNHESAAPLPPRLPAPGKPGWEQPDWVQPRPTGGRRGAAGLCGASPGLLGGRLSAQGRAWAGGWGRGTSRQGQAPATPHSHQQHPVRRVESGGRASTDRKKAQHGTSGVQLHCGPRRPGVWFWLCHLWSLFYDLKQII